MTVTYEIRSDKITKPCRFVLLADLHNKSFGKENKRLLAAIEETAPDGILVAGDMLTAIRGADYGNALSLMEKLAAGYRVYYGMGNHDSVHMPGNHQIRPPSGIDVKIHRIVGDQKLGFLTQES